jgi:Asp-tRNA(Asn)/Glu-tRNA(Gln) amidotransferase A subunit family amidase
MNIDLLSAPALARRLALRELSAEAVLRQCLENIDAREPAVHAFAHFDRQHALSAAREADRGAVRGPLHGLPVGVKDIIETSDLPTDFGSRIYSHNHTGRDAHCVAVTRAAGGIVIGKTVTSEFATLGPGPTTNPYDSARTPGGSSSGSAAGIAAGMFPLALGTQTVGSIVRPAAFCGVVGYKPTFGRLSRVGVKEISGSLDTVGCFAGSVAGAAFYASVLSGIAPLVFPENLSAPSIALAQSPFWDAALPETVSLFEVLPDALRRGGAAVRLKPLPEVFASLCDAQMQLWEFEMARCLADVREHSLDEVHPILAMQLVRGMAIPLARYDEIQALALQARGQFEDFFREVDVLIVPSSTGQAPVGLASIGDNVFNRGWNLLHGPCVHVPKGYGPQGLPLGVQVIGAPGRDKETLAAAHWIEVSVAFEARRANP